MAAAHQPSPDARAQGKGTAAGRPRVGPGTSGFTLLEVLVAVAILSLSLTSLLSSQMAALRATDEARRLSSVAFLAEAQLVEIEWELKTNNGAINPDGTQQEGWGVDDQTFEGDFSEEGWPDVKYVCVVDLIEMPDYNELVEAKDASETDGMDDMGVQDAGDQAFGAIGMVWPVIKEAIEQSIRKSWCTVRWSPDGEPRRLPNEPHCGDDEFQCLTVMTFWTDPTKLLQLPQLGGEANEDDDVDDDDGGGGADGDNPDAGPSGGRPSSSGGNNRGRGLNPAIPPGPGSSRGGMK